MTISKEAFIFTLFFSLGCGACVSLIMTNPYDYVNEIIDNQKLQTNILVSTYHKHNADNEAMQQRIVLIEKYFCVSGVNSTDIQKLIKDYEKDGQRCGY